MECLTCGKITYFSPAVAQRRRYCNGVCYAARPASSPALAIIRLLGGSRALAERMGLVHRTVRAWNVHGIPSKYHFDILQIAKELGQQKKVTFENLRETLAYGRAWRKAGVQALKQKHPPGERACSKPTKRRPPARGRQRLAATG